MRAASGSRSTPKSVSPHQAEGEAHHLRVSVEAGAVRVLGQPAIQGGVGAAREGLGEGQVACAVEGRLHQLAVLAPGLALAGEKAGADHVPHPVVGAALHVVGGVLDEDVLHSLRVVDQDVGHRAEAVAHVVAPARAGEEQLQRVAEGLEEVAEERQPRMLGDGARGRALAGERGAEAMAPECGSSARRYKAASHGRDGLMAADNAGAPAAPHDDDMGLRGRDAPRSAWVWRQSSLPKR